ncbi:uncharacterized protein K489DRAFT_372351 [Dissoconium aciculare CBS 342.82]|uniref:Protein kinase domain-containing protein n=1 Tax=Dissoconium aciculare CBS 342.82 TaxID=1314786 RepID=A0A6J3LXU9_9PEZI|nr:uncharacterized protein K489DRAFT_372351 [Dissoconium aciculare CBS 342.82]KAF1820571.1 hypothetical protein K489DRAFT_372351 [Dissoconium aciculare CBS 342.82]
MLPAAMDPSQHGHDSGEPVSAQTITIPIKFEEISCTICGNFQLLRETSNTVVALLHLDHASSNQIARFRGVTGYDSDAHEQPGNLHKTTTSVTKVIVKSFKDVQVFSDEVEAYRRMRSIQGTIVPDFYGPGEVDGLPSIVLEYIVGYDLCTYQTTLENLPKLARAVENCSVAIAKCGVVQWDPRLDGVIVVRPPTPWLTIKMIDFSHVEFDKSFAIGMSKGGSNFLIRRYAELMGWSWSINAKDY